MAQDNYATVLHFSTDDVERDARVDVWREILAPHNIDTDGTELTARMTTVRMDGLLLRRMDCSPLRIDRTRELIRRDGLEHIVLHQASSAFRIESEQGERTVSPGVVTFNDLAQPARRSLSEERDGVAICLSREQVEAVMPDCGHLHGAPLDAAGNELLGHHIRATLEWSEAGDAPDIPAVARACALVLACAASPTVSRLGAVKPARDVARLAQARRFIRQHLADPELDPEQIATALKVSRSTLFAIFEPIGGVSRYVMEQRLARAYRMLASGTQAARVSAVATACGFSNLAHFSRSFRAAFGVAPSEAQAGAVRLVDRVVQEKHQLLKIWSYELG